MNAIYRQTNTKVEIVQVKPKKGWPNHCLRAVFAGGDGSFTFHKEMLHEWFIVDDPDSQKGSA